MSAAFQLTPQAIEDLDTIWSFIAKDSEEAADRVEREIIATCRRLAKHPLMGTKRQDGGTAFMKLVNWHPAEVAFWRTFAAIPRYSNQLCRIGSRFWAEGLAV